MAEQLKKEIVKLASTRMREVGIKSISIDDLCREMRISKKTFYVYYANKDDLIKDLLLHHESNIESEIQRTLSGKKVLELMLSFHTMAAKSRDVRKAPPLLFDLEKYYPQLFSEHINHMREMTRLMLERLMQQGMDENVFRGDLDVKRAASVLSCIHQLVMDLIYHPSNNKAGLTTADIRCGLNIFILGILSDDGKTQLSALMKKENK